MAKAVMIQGTMSGAGKSLLTAGLCRIFHQDGYRAAPFKSQNMALNSYITEEGLEMGRAQVMQAQAAGIEPLVCMNPILLKPTDDVGSQVIVEGKVQGNMSAKEYFAYKKELIPQILSSYHKLEEIADIIVIEGAGSPAEINLKQNDIVNMGLAELLDVPVLLAGDIDRGGVFAQLYGTVMLLEPQERERIFGLIINKFRGDKSILQPGIDMLEEKIKIPVAGVIPYLHVDIEEEDSLSSRLSNKNRKKKAIDLAVIRLPRISNYTDFHAFEAMPEVSVRYISTVSELKDPDMVILPGTKNTISDLKWLRQQGLEGAIKQLAAAGKVIFGICGGFQMLGKKISDPDSVEGKGELAGIGLLDMDTCFGQEKIRARVTGEILNIEGSLKTVSSASFTGYEIHMGQSVLTPGVRPFCMVKDEISGEKWAEGGCNKNVYGTYVHGIFDDAGIRKQIIMALGKAKGMELSDIAPVDYAEYQQAQYDKLALGIRQNIDLDMIYASIRKERNIEKWKSSWKI